MLSAIVLRTTNLYCRYDNRKSTLETIGSRGVLFCRSWYFNNPARAWARPVSTIISVIITTIARARRSFWGVGKKTASRAPGVQYVNELGVSKFQSLAWGLVKVLTVGAS
jgi:hypothetical protein